MFNTIIVLLNRLYGKKSNGSPITNIITCNWFITVCLAFIIRLGRPGSCSEIIRTFNLCDEHYCSVDDFFRSDAIHLDCLYVTWWEIVKDNFDLYKRNDRIVLTGDGVLYPKEGRKMPGVTRLHKESGTQSKPSSFFGVHTAAIGILTQSKDKERYNTPLINSIGQGLSDICGWENTPHPDANQSLEVQMINKLEDISAVFGSDIYYLSDKATMNRNCIIAIKETAERTGRKTDLVTPLKSNNACYKEFDEANYKGVGPHPVRGEKIYPMQEAKKKKGYKKTKVIIYGKKVTVKYKIMDLLWGDGLNAKMRFIMFDAMNGRPPFVMATTDLTMSAEDAVELYSYRFLCEEQFKVYKRVFRGYDFHFWTKRIEAQSFMAPKDTPGKLSLPYNSESQEAILKTIKAYEVYLQIVCICVGVIQQIATKQKLDGPIMECEHRRKGFTPVKVSEEAVCRFIRKNLDDIFAKYGDTEIIQFITRKQKPAPLVNPYYDLL